MGVFNQPPLIKWLYLIFLTFDRGILDGVGKLIQKSTNSCFVTANTNIYYIKTGCKEKIENLDSVVRL